MNPKILHKAGRILPPLALAEWGAILTYFYCSDRLTAYLHPLFRPLVFVTGILLLLSAMCSVHRGNVLAFGLWRRGLRDKTSENGSARTAPLRGIDRADCARRKNLSRYLWRGVR